MPSSRDLPTRPPTLQADPLPSTPQGKPHSNWVSNNSTDESSKEYEYMAKKSHKTQETRDHEPQPAEIIQVDRIKLDLQTLDSATHKLF